MEVREIQNKEDWKPESLGQYVPFTQEWFYGEWQKALGREVYRFVLTSSGDRKLFSQIIKVNTSFNKCYVYIPYGPLSKELTKDEKVFYINYIRDFGERHKAIFIRVDQNIFDLNSQGYASVFQPQCERVIKIDKEKDKLISGMDKKAGYSYRYAKKNNVQVEIVSENLLLSLDRFYDGMKLSANRNSIGLYSKDYFKEILRQGEKDKNVFLVFTTHEGRLLVTSLIVISGKRATQIFSGSTDFYRKLRPAIITRIEAMDFARSLGCNEFSLGGVSTKDFPVEAWKGLSKFKEQFGGEVECVVNPGVIIISKFWYTLYKLRKHLG